MDDGLSCHVISFSSGYGLGYVNPFGVCNSHRDAGIFPMVMDWLERVPWCFRI